MSFSLTPEPNQEPKKMRARPILVWLVTGFVLSGCGLKDDLILPEATQLQAAIHAPSGTADAKTVEASQ